MKRWFLVAGALLLMAVAVFVLSGLRPKAVVDGLGTAPAGVEGRRPHGNSANEVSDMAAGTDSSRDARAPSLDELIEGSANFSEAIARTRAAFGESDPRVYYLLDMAETVCSQDPDPTGATNAKHPDPARRWAVVRLLELCEAYKPESPVAHASEGPPDLAQVYRKQGRDAAVSEANRRLRTADDFDSLYSAGQILLENDRIPLDRILPGHRQRYGPADLVPAWAMAVQLVGCSGGSACGPDSLPTAIYCAHAGCVEGVNYEQALSQGLPPAQLRAVMAFRQWILAQRQSQN